MSKRNEAFKIGDKVTRRFDPVELTVVWVSKGFKDRRDQLIATEQNGYSHPVSDSMAYEPSK